MLKSAALSAMRTWIGGHPDTRINSRIRVSADPSDRQMPVGAAIVDDLNILHFAFLWLNSLCFECRFQVINYIYGMTVL